MTAASNAPTALPPMKELAFVLGKYGWDKRFCDLTEEEVQTLIFAIQESTPLTKEINIGKLEEIYYKSTGAWPSTSIPF